MERKSELELPLVRSYIAYIGTMKLSAYVIGCFSEREVQGVIDSYIRRTV